MDKTGIANLALSNLGEARIQSLHSDTDLRVFQFTPFEKQVFHHPHFQDIQPSRNQLSSL